LPELAANRPIGDLSWREQLNFLLTNRIPRQVCTRLMGWYSRIENPALAKLSIAAWQAFDRDLDLSEAKTRSFESVQQCFVRQLEEGARAIDPDPGVVISPCDGIVGACGKVEGTRVFQAKGFPYETSDLFCDADLRERYRDGVYATLRLKPGMYHRFHAPVDCRLDQIAYVSGDTWNVNPIALRKVERLFCKNERAVVELKDTDLGAASGGHGIVLVPVAAILVASIKFHCLPDALDLRYRGPNRIACAATYRKGDELGYFQHGSTVLVFATAKHRLAEGVRTGVRLNMGQRLLEKME